MMKQQAISELQEANARFRDVLNAFTQEQFNKVPFSGSWTAAQVADHILKSQASAPEFFQGTVQATERAPDAQIAGIRDIMMNFDAKMQAPDFILPSESPLDKGELLQALQQTDEATRKVAQELDLTATCMDFEVPVLGNMTRLEWIYFMVYHTRRHTQQLEMIRQHLGG